jgi:hypothetical protein
MKHILFLFFTLIFTGCSFAQKVFSVEYENQADVKVFVVKYENQADIKVFQAIHNLVCLCFASC